MVYRRCQHGTAATPYKYEQSPPSRWACQHNSGEFGKQALVSLGECAAHISMHIAVTTSMEMLNSPFGTQASRGQPHAQLDSQSTGTPPIDNSLRQPPSSDIVNNGSDLVEYITPQTPLLASCCVTYMSCRHCLHLPNHLLQATIGSGSSSVVGGAVMPQ